MFIVLGTLTSIYDPTHPGMHLPSKQKSPFSEIYGCHGHRKQPGSQQELGLNKDSTASI